MMKAPKNALRRLSSRLRSAAGRFRRDEDGAIILMVAGSIFSLIVVVGGAIDVYRYEMLRKRAQNTLDRAVLAAAALDQKIESGEEVVRSYMKSAGLELPTNARFESCPTAGPSVCCPKEAQAAQINCMTDWRDYKKSFRSMDVQATFSMPMAFLWLAGEDEWNVPVHASAMERERKIEISVVLDISGSMRWDVGDGSGRRRIDALRPAATNFIDSILKDETAVENTSISIVPFSGQVNMGRAMFDHLGIARKHPHSSCVHFNDSDFARGMPDFGNRSQVGHFTMWNYHDKPGSNDKSYGHSTANDRWEPHDKDWFTDPSASGALMGPRIGEPWWCPDDPHGYSVTIRDIKKWGNSTVRYDGEDMFFNHHRSKFHEIDWSDRRFAGTIWEDNEFVLPAGHELFILEGKEDDDLLDHVTACDVVDRPTLRENAGDPIDRVCDLTSNGNNQEKPSFASALAQGDIRIDGDPTTITYLSNNREELVDQIAGLHLYDGTGTSNGMLWASILLDPEFRTTFASALSDGVVPTYHKGPARPAEFAVRPADFDDDGTSKYIVLMTDGRFNDQFEIKSSKAGDPNVAYHEIAEDEDGLKKSDPKQELRARASTKKVGEQFSTMCELAKQNNVEVFTIGFALAGSKNKEIRDHLANCASTSSHYFDVQDGNLDAAFQAIAATIQKVRLTS